MCHPLKLWPQYGLALHSASLETFPRVQGKATLCGPCVPIPAAFPQVPSPFSCVPWTVHHGWHDEDSGLLMFLISSAVEKASHCHSHLCPRISSHSSIHKLVRKSTARVPHSAILSVWWDGPMVFDTRRACTSLLWWFDCEMSPRAHIFEHSVPRWWCCFERLQNP